MKLITEAKLTPGTKVLVRADLDIPIKNGEIKDPFRLDAIMPTLFYLQNSGTHIIIAGHMGRPHGNPNPNLSTKNLKPYFDAKLGLNNYTLLENLRFDIREEQNSDEFAKELSQKAEIYVNESFATCHEPHASIVGVPNYLPAYAGLTLQDEITVLSTVLKKPKRPLTAIIGGAKIDSKLPLVKKLLTVADYVLLGGLIALNYHDEKPQNLLTPLDYKGSNQDIGDKTIEKYESIIKKSKTVIWAGPLGQWEEQNFAEGTRMLAMATAMSETYWVAGGGDTISALKSLGDWLSHVDFVSTGGSAMLEFLVNETLPGLSALGYKTT